MTLEEAIALAIEEGMRSEPVPDNAMAIILHRRKEPSDEHINTLIEALRIVQDGLKEQPFLSRDLAAALWIVGVEANAMMYEVHGEADAVLDATDYQIEDLLTAIESVFCNDWFVEDMRKGRGHMATAVLERQKVDTQGMEELSIGESENVPSEYHWTVDAFMKASDAGVFGHDARLELIQGRIFEIMGQGPRHSSLASVIADMLREAAGKRFAIREEKPIHIAFDGEPIPDISIVSGRQVDYNDHHPAPENVQLLVEVSVTTVDYDLGGKALLYSQAGILDYWVVVENEEVIVRHRQPSPAGYLDVTHLAGTDSLSTLAMPEAVWTINALLGKGD